MSNKGDLVSSNNGTLHVSTGEVSFTKDGEKVKMRCGMLSRAVGHPYNRYMVEDWRGDLCSRCFDEEDT